MHPGSRTTERDKQMKPTQQTPDGKQVREEEGQDHTIGHATQGKSTKTDGSHKVRNVRNRTGIIIIEHNNANIITNNITKHVKRNVAITNENNQQTRKGGRKPTRHQHTNATNGKSPDSSGISLIKKY
jgi:hypothetical protein